MRKKRFLAAILLAVSFCFVSGAGYGEIHELLLERSAKRRIDSLLLDARLSYIMTNPTSFLNVEFHHDEEGMFTEEFPEEIPREVDTKGKIIITIRDNRKLFSKVKSLQSLLEKDKTLLLDFFKATLENVYSFIWYIATDMDADIVGLFYLTRTDPDDTDRFLTEKEKIKLVYFYQGEYHLWEE